MQEIDDQVQNKINGIPDNRYEFDFEQVNWNTEQTVHKSNMTKNALNQIEKERENIEKDFKLLQVIEDERSKLENLMIKFLQMKIELEEKLEGSSSL